MTRFSQPVPRIATTFRLVSSFIVALTCGTILEHETSASLATGSVTARVYLCPESVSLAAVQQAPSSTLLAACEPFDSDAPVLQLRPTSGSQPIRGQALAPGILFWPWLEFGDYDIDWLPAESRFSDLLITTDDGIPVADQEQALVTIGGGELDIERHFFLFALERAEIAGD